MNMDDDLLDLLNAEKRGNRTNLTIEQVSREDRFATHRTNAFIWVPLHGLTDVRTMDNAYMVDSWTSELADGWHHRLGCPCQFCR